MENNYYQNNLLIEQLRQSPQFMDWRRYKLKGEIFLLVFMSVFLGLLIMGVLYFTKKEGIALPTIIMMLFLLILSYALIYKIKTCIALIRADIRYSEYVIIKSKSPDFSRNKSYYVVVDSTEGEQTIQTLHREHIKLQPGYKALLFRIRGKEPDILSVELNESPTETIIESISVKDLSYFKKWKREQFSSSIISLLFILFLFGALIITNFTNIKDMLFILPFMVVFFGIPTFILMRAIKDVRKIQHGEFSYLSVGQVVHKETEIVRTNNNKKRTYYWVTGKTQRGYVQAEVSRSLYLRMNIGHDMVFFSTNSSTLTAFPLD